MGVIPVNTDVLNSFLRVDVSENNVAVVRETLTRMGIANNQTKTLTQSCHLKRHGDHYYLVHFKEVFLLDGRESTLSENDIQRRNAVAILLRNWGLLDYDSSVKERIEAEGSVWSIFVLPYSKKQDWTLRKKI